MCPGGKAGYHPLDSVGLWSKPVNFRAPENSGARSRSNVDTKSTETEMGICLDLQLFPLAASPLNNSLGTMRIPVAAPPFDG